MLKLFIKTLVAYKNNEDGVTAIEYGLIAAGISLAIVALVFAFGDQLRNVFTEMDLSLAEAVTQAQDNR